jgi:D-sedoheptulose 7-phosphate isomerase
MKVEEIKSRIQEAVDLKVKLLQNQEFVEKLSFSADKCVQAFREAGAVFFCGNGGSAADAQHLAAEFSGRFYYDRPPLNSEALHVNTSYLTAVANDYSFDEVYARLVKAKMKAGDILIGLSTSGNSKNIIKAFQQAKQMNITTIALTGESGGELKDLSDILLNIPSTDTPRIQELHILIGHIICEIVESEIFPKL